jgi:peptide/nickel transport system substrate-binding protein
VGWFFYLDPEKGHPALQDMRVRQAIALALDRFSLNQNLLLGLTQPAMSYWDNTPYIDPTLQPLPYDPEKAKQLLDEAGWIDNDGDGVRDQDGLPLSLTYGTIKRQIRLEAQKIAQQQLAQVGIKLELLDYDTDTFFLGYNQGGPAATGQLDIFELAAQTAFPDPDTPDFLCSEIPSMDASLGRNWSAICDSEVDQLFKLQSTQIDSAARQQTFHQISKLIYERVYFLGIWQDPDLWGINSRLINVKLSGATPFYNIIEWDVAP